MKNQNQLRAAIYGAGSLGTILGAYISAAGKQIDLINRIERGELAPGFDNLRYF